jgi:hypothetical protein
MLSVKLLLAPIRVVRKERPVDSTFPAEFNLLLPLTHAQFRPDNRPHSRNEDGPFGFF